MAEAELGGPALGAEAGKEARDPEEIEAATLSRSTPGGVDPAPTFERLPSQKGSSVKVSDDWERRIDKFREYNAM